MSKRLKQFLAAIGGMSVLAIVSDTFPMFLRSIDYFLHSKQLTVGAILTMMVPFVLILIKLSKEKEKKARSLLIERRQMQIAFNINEILEALKVESKWSIQEIGSNHTVQRSYGKFYLSLLAVMKQQKRRMNMLTNLLKSSISKKLLALLIGAAVAVLNKRFNLELSPEEVVGFFILVMSYILGQSHVDAKKVLAGIKDSPLLQMGFTEAIPVLSEIHSGINNLLADVKKNDNSQAFKDAMQAYAQIKPILDALKHPDPVAIIPEEQVSA